MASCVLLFLALAVYFGGTDEIATRNSLTPCVQERMIQGYRAQPSTVSFLTPGAVANLANIPYGRLPASVQRLIDGGKGAKKPGNVLKIGAGKMKLDRHNGDR
jgi:hypothetical protein